MKLNNKMTIEELARYCDAKDLDKFGEVLTFAINWGARTEQKLMLDRQNIAYKDYSKVTIEN